MGFEGRNLDPAEAGFADSTKNGRKHCSAQPLPVKPSVKQEKSDPRSYSRVAREYRTTTCLVGVQ